MDTEFISLENASNIVHFYVILRKVKCKNNNEIIQISNGNEKISINLVPLIIQ